MVFLFIVNCAGWYRLVCVTQQYLQTDPSGRDPNTVLLQIKQGFEPPSFTGFFGVWDRELWSVSIVFSQHACDLDDVVLLYFPFMNHVTCLFCPISPSMFSVHIVYALIR